MLFLKIIWTIFFPLQILTLKFMISVQYVDLFTSENIKNSSVVHIKCVWKKNDTFGPSHFIKKKKTVPTYREHNVSPHQGIKALITLPTLVLSF